MNFIDFLIQEWILVTILAVLIIAYMLRDRINSGIPVSPQELTNLINSDKAVVLDIRPIAEFKAGHLVNAINIPYEKINSDVASLEKYKSKIIIVVDKMGQYSGAIGRILIKQGFEARRLSGGIGEWQAQNLPLIKGK